MFEAGKVELERDRSGHGLELQFPPMRELLICFACFVSFTRRVLCTWSAVKFWRGVLMKCIMVQYRNGITGPGSWFAVGTFY